MFRLQSLRVLKPTAHLVSPWRYHVLCFVDWFQDHCIFRLGSLNQIKEILNGVVAILALDCYILAITLGLISAWFSESLFNALILCQNGVELVYYTALWEASRGCGLG